MGFSIRSNTNTEKDGSEATIASRFIDGQQCVGELRLSMELGLSKGRSLASNTQWVRNRFIAVAPDNGTGLTTELQCTNSVDSPTAPTDAMLSTRSEWTLIKGIVDDSAVAPTQQGNVVLTFAYGATLTISAWWHSEMRTGSSSGPSGCPPSTPTTHRLAAVPQVIRNEKFWRLAGVKARLGRGTRQEWYKRLMAMRAYGVTDEGLESIWRVSPKLASPLHKWEVVFPRRFMKEASTIRFI